MANAISICAKTANSFGLHSLVNVWRNENVPVGYVCYVRSGLRDERRRAANRVLQIVVEI